MTTMTMFQSAGRIVASLNSAALEVARTSDAMFQSAGRIVASLNEGVRHPARDLLVSIRRADRRLIERRGRSAAQSWTSSFQSAGRIVASLNRVVVAKQSDKYEGSAKHKIGVGGRRRFETGRRRFGEQRCLT